MKEYIEREALLEEIECLTITINGMREGKTILAEALKAYRTAVLSKITEAHAADVVERKRGEWIDVGHKIRCSVCDHGVFLGTTDPVVHKYEKENFNFCPNCGADMRGEKHEAD